jgi:hypothetical protein
LLVKINNIFNLDTNKKISVFNNALIVNGPIRQNDIESIMVEEDFIFCKCIN